MSTRQFLGDHAVRLGDLVQIERALRIALWHRESHDEVLRVLDRAADDNDFIAALACQDTKTLEGYHLTWQAKAALLSGDLRWIERHVGSLTERQQTWLRCRLSQEIW